MNKVHSMTTEEKYEQWLKENGENPSLKQEYLLRKSWMDGYQEGHIQGKEEGWNNGYESAETNRTGESL